MDAFANGRSDVTYDSGPPFFVAASSAGAARRASASIEAAGGRVAGSSPIEDAIAGLERHAGTRAVWVEIERDGGAAMDNVLRHVDAAVTRGRYAAIVSLGRDMIDPVTALVRGADVELIVDGNEAARAAAAALASSRSAIRPRLADSASDRSGERLRQLSGEVGRIAETLARLSNGPSPVPSTIVTADGAAPDIAVETVRAAIRARRLRSRFFPQDLFADPAWDMLLDLLHAEIAQLRVQVSSLCIAAAVPATTALRWLKAMVERGLFVRREDPHDGRRVFVELAPEASLAMRRYFAELARVNRA